MTMVAHGAPFRLATVVRSSLASGVLVPELRRTLLGIDPMLALDDVKTMDSRIDESLIFPRSLMLTAALFAAMALLLSAVGVYGVMAYSVAQRQREIGVRMALGARPSQILMLFLRLGGRLLLAGLAAGALASVAAGRLVGSLLFDVSPGSPIIYLGAVAALAAVVMLAAFLPSLRAAGVSVMESLRRE
jgi:ABC-type antimicrobial peptide transport system permease subunit